MLRYSILVLSLSLAALSVTAAGPAGRQTDCTMKPDVLHQQMMSGGEFVLPQLRIYNAEGQFMKGLERFYAPGLLGSMIEDSLAADSGNSERKLDTELASMTRPDGSALGDSPEASLYVVKLWAEWCKPCDQLTAELDAYLDEHPDLDVHVYNVEADPMKGMPTGTIKSDD